VLLWATLGVAVADSPVLDDPPPDELLEFLGAWDDGQGNFVDPLDFAKLLDEQPEEASDDDKQ
jgi:hypothetical protein